MLGWIAGVRVIASCLGQAGDLAAWLMLVRPLFLAADSSQAWVGARRRLHLPEASMRLHLLTRAVLTASLAASAAVTAPAGPAAAAAAAATATTAAGAVLASWAGPARRGGTGAAAPLLVINGDRVLVSRGGGVHAATIQRAPGGVLAGSLAMLRFGARSFLVPVAALPYLGHGLDPRLFDVSALVRAEHGGRLPVALRYQGRLPALPGVTVTRAGTGTAQGYLTASSAPLFGAALARQLMADHARGSYGAGGLFAGGLSVSLPGPGAAPARPPAEAHTRPVRHFPMHVLTVTGTNLAGRPDTGDLVSVLNVSDLAALDPLIASDNVFYHGTAKYSAPSGTYWATGIFFTRSGFRLDVLPQFTVSGDTTVHVSERAAASKVSTVTPRPAVTRGSTLTVVRASAHAVVSEGFGTFGGGSIWINPTSHPVTHGALHVFTTVQASSPRGPGIPYGYMLNLAGPPGIIPPQQFTVRPADLAAVSERYYQDVSSVGGWLDFGGTPYQIRTSFIGGLILPVRLPGPMTQYLSARPAQLWQSFYDEYNVFRTGTTSGGQTDAFRLLHGGQRLAETWNRYPLHPEPSVSFPGTSLFPALPSAVRAGDTVLLDVTPFSDNFAGHTGSGFSVNFPGKVNEVSGSYALFQNGVKIAGGDAAKTSGFGGPLFVRAKLSPAPSAIKLVLTASRAGPRFPLSATSRDVWTWQSRPEPGATVPPPWECGVTVSHGRLVFDRHCVVQGMLVASYRVAGLSLTGTAPAGRQQIVLAVTHLAQAAPSRVIHARLQVSFDNGKTWRRAAVRRLGMGRFLAHFTTAAAQGVTLRLSARDRAGDTITETIARAYHTSA